MSSSYEKSVKGATKIKLAPPKAKYIEHILAGTRTGEAGVAEIFRTLQLRVRDSTWTIAFKALIVVHIMIREGKPNLTLAYIADAGRRAIGVTNYTDVQTQGRNILTYSKYLLERARVFSQTRVDHVGRGTGRLKQLSIDKGLLMETEGVQREVDAILKCDLFADEPDNEISLTAFRLLVLDLLVLFQVENEGTISVLEHYFEMSRPDAERALGIYKTFTRQTDAVVKYLSLAKQYEHATRLEIPRIKHAPTGLASSLEEYLNDKDFETNRRQYLAEKEFKTTGKKPATSQPAMSGTGTRPDFEAAMKESKPLPPPKGPDPNLIDFFESIEQNQQTLGSQGSYNPFQQNQATGNNGLYSQPDNYGFQQQNGFAQSPAPMQVPQSTNPFLQFQNTPQPAQPMPQPHQQPQLEPQYTGAGFGGYTPQPQFPQPTGQQHISPPPQSNPFRPLNGDPAFYGQPSSPFGQQQPSSPFSQQPSFTGFGQQQQQPQQQFGNMGAQQQPSNPFRQQSLPAVMEQMPTNTGNPFSNSSPSPFAPSSTGPFAPPQSASPVSMMPQRTGTNPFAAPPPQPNPQSPAGGVMTHATGSTNPFKQSAFVNQQTGLGWQSGPQGTMGGLEQMSTNPVFPRPGQAQQQQQQAPNTWPYS